MDTRQAETVIICPTLSLVRAAEVLEKAREAAGMACGVLVASDYERRGAVVAGNVLIVAALEWGAEHICYLNDDTSGFQQGWLKRLVEAVGSKPEYGAALAGCPCRSSPQKEGHPGLPPAIIELTKPGAWVCAVIKAQMFRELDMLDETLIHYADDSDFEMRMKRAGYKSVYVQDVYVHHTRTPKEQEASPWWVHDKNIFRTKWGQV